MQITCPNCSQNYNLDERLLPSGGAPVQCTNCSLVFTASPQGAAAPRPIALNHQTQPVGPRNGGDAARTTQQFGQKNVAEAARTTQVFGKQSSPGRTTQVFGSQPGAAKGPTTQMFGAQGAPAAAAATSTQLFGKGAPTHPPAPSSPGRTTQVFGRASVPAQSRPATAPPSAPRTTQVFGAVSAGVPPPAVPATPRNGEPPAAAPAWANHSFPPPEHEPLPGSMSLTQEFAVLDIATRGPANVDPLDEGLHLPPESASATELLEDRGSVDEAVRVVMQSQARTRRRWVGTALAIVLTLVAAVGVRAFLRRPHALPPEVLAACDASFDLLRRDDERSRSVATEKLKSLVAQHPEAVEVRADQVLALSLELDDVKLRIQHIKVESVGLQRAIEHLQDHQTPSEWQTMVEEDRHSLEVLTQQGLPLLAQQESLDLEASAAFKQLTDRVGPAANPPLSVIRAEAVYFGVRGVDQAIGLSERYRQAGGKDGWDAIALAEFALNAHVTPNTKESAMSAVELLQTQDSGLIRAYLLSARLKRELKDSEGAAQELEAAAALNPHHDTARELLAWH